MALWDTWIDTLTRDSYLPAVQGGFTHQQLLDAAWEQVVRHMAPMMITARSTFFRESYDITLVAAQATYDIPPFAMLNKLQLGYLIDSNGAIGKLHRCDPPEDEFFFETSDGHPIRIRLHDKQIELIPAPSAGDLTTWPTLRTWIYRRPGRFVRATDDGSGDNVARAARVLTSAAGLVTYTGIMPSSFEATSSHDFFSQTSPYRRVGTAVAALTAPDTSSQTFSTANAALITAGDYVCLTNETCFMPVPVEMGGHVKDLVIASIGKTQADKDAYKTALETLARDVKVMFPAAADPLEGNPQVMTLRHSPFLRAIVGRRGRGMVTD